MGDKTAEPLLDRGTVPNVCPFDVKLIVPVGTAVPEFAITTTEKLAGVWELALDTELERVVVVLRRGANTLTDEVAEADSAF